MVRVMARGIVIVIYFLLRVGGCELEVFGWTGGICQCGMSVGRDWLWIGTVFSRA